MLQNLGRLKVFYHVFSKGSVLSASKILHVSQSAVSQSLQKLEEEIQSQLFTRMHKRLVPTAAGERLFAVVHPFMQELAGCLKNIKQSREKPFGELRIGAPVEFGKAYFPGMVARFREQYPEVTFYLKLGNPATLLPLVETGQIDFAFVDLFLTQNQFFANLDIYHFSPVVDEEIILACSKRYYEKQIKSDHSFSHLKSQQFIAYRHNAQDVKNWFKHHFNKGNVKYDVVLVVDSQQALISAVKHHAGVGIVASHLVAKEMKEGLIVPIHTPKPKIINQISLVLLQDKVPTLTEKIFQKFLIEKIQSMNLFS
ncbi:DNA-binding transcriptional regulator, LysR family [Desulfocicer vacuolatum DSM 3385]|uniref:DNA-binding transcriptional regulator, LysR family n=1 Tax=Desulfocicer vacuolatum DSM 3385 TaxID=1121400 RepID=A0A1W2EGV9_9BACT|nr:LysR family transcriptional regulator [Desulfocicer vacuolatum]SMD08917.1 DNA-binding transcriptional regulator, LysR family [Desulfocicer vacuolatum DSM 3385]